MSSSAPNPLLVLRPAPPRRRPARGFAMAAVVGAAWLAGCAPPPPAPPANVLLIVSDTFRADALDCAGAPQRTPNLCALARRGGRFSRAYANAPWTMASVTSMMAGHSPGRYARPVPDDPSVLRFQVPDGELLLAEALAARGYDTPAYVENGVALRVNAFQGFADRPAPPAGSPPLDPRLGFEASTPQLRKMRPLLTRLTAPEARPFFAVYWFRDPHAPYRPDERFTAGIAPREPLPHPLVFYSNLGHVNAPKRGEFKLRNALPDPSPAEVDYLRQLYHGEVASIDERVGFLLRALALSGREATTLVVFTSDHGEGFGEHGIFLHGQSFHEELVRVPLILAGPGVPAGTVVEDPVTLADLMPTLSDLLGVECLDAPRGRSLRPLLAGERPAELVDRPHYLVNPLREPDADAVVLGLHKLITGERDRRLALYDLAADPGETADLAASRPDLVARLLRAARAVRNDDARFRDAVARAEGRPTAPVTAEDEETQRTLRSLGYLD